MAMTLNADCKVLRISEGANETLKIARVLVRLQPGEGCTATEIRVAVVGNVDSGKSTMIGVLTKGQLDNGRGAARSLVFRHRHELENGRTSSISQQVMGFNSKGEVTNSAARHVSMSDIVEDSAKVGREGGWGGGS
jgi:GTPase